MDHARIAIFEDSELLQDNLATILGLEKHHVVARATTMEAAVKTIDALPEASVDIAIVDGNLSPGAYGCTEGVRITGLLHEKFKSVTVIGYSGERDIEGADIQFGKLKSILELVGIIREL